MLRFEVFDRDTANQVELFRAENVPLETEEAKLGQQYQKLSGSLTVQFRGVEKTLPQMAGLGREEASLIHAHDSSSSFLNLSWRATHSLGVTSSRTPRYTG